MTNSMYIARNKNGELKLFSYDKPWRDLDCSPDEQQWITDDPTFYECYIDSALFPNLKWEDEPVEVGLFIKTL